MSEVVAEVIAAPMIEGQYHSPRYGLWIYTEDIGYWSRAGYEVRVVEDQQ